MVVLAALMGYVLASPGAPEALPLLAALVGTGLVAAGASALNMVIERRVDARMRRTQDRPLPAGTAAYAGGGRVRARAHVARAGGAPPGSRERWPRVWRS